MAVQFNQSPKPQKKEIPVNKMQQKFIDWGIAKTPKQANRYLNAMALVFFGLSLLIWFL